MSAIRGCGSRVSGGCYAELGLSPGGSPLEEFMLCPPIPIDPGALGLSARGVKLIERNGVWHVIDWVGTNHYPNATDDLEEIRRLGMSARLELASRDEYAKLGPGSRILRVHANAFIVGPEDRRYYWEHRHDMTEYGYEWSYCPKHNVDHGKEVNARGKVPEMCIGLLYDDVVLGRPMEKEDDPRAVVRQMPSFEYTARRAPEGAGNYEYQPAIYASFPIQRLVVVEDKAGGSHTDKAKKAAGSSLFDEATGIVQE